MQTTDRRVDAYLAKAPAYARPILVRLRRALHAGDGSLTEDIKWGAPALMKNGLVCSFMAFKHHVAVWFHKGALLQDPAGVLIPGKTVTMRAVHYTDVDEVDDAALADLVSQAVALNVAGVKAKTTTRAPIAVPPELRRALSRAPSAKAAFDALPPSHRREHCAYVAEAKRSETRARRVAKTLAALRDPHAA